MPVGKRKVLTFIGVLEKMGARFKEAPRDVRKTLQQEYSEMLRGMMKAMKENYDVLIQMPPFLTAPY